MSGTKVSIKKTIGKCLKEELNLPEKFQLKQFEVASCSSLSGVEVNLRGYLPDETVNIVEQENARDGEEVQTPKKEKKAEKEKKVQEFSPSNLDPDVSAHVSFVRKELKKRKKHKELSENQLMVVNGLGRGRISRVQAAQLINMYRELLRQR